MYCTVGAPDRLNASLCGYHVIVRRITYIYLIYGPSYLEHTTLIGNGNDYFFKIALCCNE